MFSLFRSRVCGSSLFIEVNLNHTTSASPIEKKYVRKGQTRFVLTLVHTQYIHVHKFLHVTINPLPVNFFIVFLSKHQQNLVRIHILHKGWRVGGAVCTQLPINTRKSNPKI